MEKFFEKISKVKKAKLRNGKEYQWSANVYNPGTGEFTICGYVKDGKTWSFISHSEEGKCPPYLGHYDIVLEEPEQWVNIINMNDEKLICHSEVYSSSKEAALDQSRVIRYYRHNQLASGSLYVYCKRLNGY